MANVKPGIGLTLMILSFIGVIGTALYVLTANDIDGMRIASLLNFLCLLTFMLGSILEIKDLWFTIEILNQNERAKINGKKTIIKTQKSSYIPQEMNLTSRIVFFIIILLIMIIIVFMLML